MPNKYALIIGNTEYTDAGLAQLSAPGKDAEDFARVLKSPEIAAFDEVATFVNGNASNLKESIEDFFTGKKPDDLLVFYFSGHGVRDESGLLYLAVKNTNRSRLRSTAIEAEFVSRLMDQSRSRRQVIILDCCNSGAFAQGTKAETGGAMGMATTFEGTGYGRVVLTATDSTQFAWEGDKIIGSETDNSLFTHFLIKGLEGDADKDGDGKITVDKLYDYVYEQIVNRTPKQTPGKWSYKEQGEIILRSYISRGDTTTRTAKLRLKLLQQEKFFQTEQDRLLQEKAEIEAAARKAKEQTQATQMRIALGKTKNEFNRPAAQIVEQKKTASNLPVLALSGVFGMFLIIGLCVIAAFIIVVNLKPTAISAPTEKSVVTDTPMYLMTPTLASTLPAVSGLVVPPTSTLAPFTPTAAVDKGVPVIQSVDLENDWSSGELVILQKIKFEDSQGDVNFVDYKVVNTTATNLEVHGGAVNISAYEQQYGAVILGTWKCGSASYSVTLQVFVKDAMGNQSDPYTYSMVCN